MRLRLRTDRLAEFWRQPAQPEPLGDQARPVARTLVRHRERAASVSVGEDARANARGVRRLGGRVVHGRRRHAATTSSFDSRSRRATRSCRSSDRARWGRFFSRPTERSGGWSASRSCRPRRRRESDRGALLKEIAWVARLQHPNILPLYEAGEHADHPYYVMPYVRDGSLRALLERRGRPRCAETLDLVHGIARGLVARARAADSSLRREAGERARAGRALLRDGLRHRSQTAQRSAGVGRRAQRARLLRRNAGVREPGASAGDRDVDQRSDVYSLACVVVRDAVGPHAVRRDDDGGDRHASLSRAAANAAELAPDVSPQMAFVLERAMSLDPTLRPASARELADVSGARRRFLRWSRAVVSPEPARPRRPPRDDASPRAADLCRGSR